MRIAYYIGFTVPSINPKAQVHWSKILTIYWTKLYKTLPGAICVYLKEKITDIWKLDNC